MKNLKIKWHSSIQQIPKIIWDNFQGKDEQPISLIASNQIEFPAHWLFFKQPVQRWLLQKKSKIKSMNYRMGSTKE